jgi:hypothetical protein
MKRHIAYKLAGWPEPVSVKAALIKRILISESSIYLLSIYDKSDKDNISDKEIDNLLKGL